MERLFHPRTSRRLGVSTIELLVAVVVTALGLLGLVAVYTFGTQAGKDSEKMLEAERRAVVLLETLIRENRAFSGGFPPSWIQAKGTLVAEEEPVPLNAAPFAGLFPEGEGWLRRCSMRRLGDTGHFRDMVEIKVRVGWKDEARERWVEIVGLHRR